MSHWIEEAEHKTTATNDNDSEEKKKLSVKKKNIEINKSKIELEYIKIIAQFQELVDRINDLPSKDRIPFGHISYKQKSNKLNNDLYQLKSSKRVLKREYSGILSPYKSHHYKYTRTVFISISGNLGKILFEYKEMKSKRVRLHDEKSESKSYLKQLFSVSKRPTLLITNEFSKISIEGITEKLILKHMDWLAFKSNGTELFK